MASLEARSKKKWELYDAGFSSDFFSYKKISGPARKSSLGKGKVYEMRDMYEEPKNFKRVVSYIVGYDYNIQMIIDRIRNKNFEFLKLQIRKNINIIYISYDRFVFIFDFASVVLWGFDEFEEKIILEQIFLGCKLKIKSSEDPYLIFHVKKGEIFEIMPHNKLMIESSDIMEKLAISYAIAQSSILRYYELEVDITIEDTKYIPLDMRDKGVINLSVNEISKKVGLIFQKISQVNLQSDILDVPDLFWDFDDIEANYNRLREHLELSRRIEILNKRMEILKDLYDVLNNEIKTQNKFSLVWIVVYLIVVEVFIAVFWKIIVKDLIGLF